MRCGEQTAYPRCSVSNLYLLTDLLTRLLGTRETARDADDGQRADQQLSATMGDDLGRRRRTSYGS